MDRSVIDDQEDFQVIVSSDDYRKLIAQTQVIEQLNKQNEQLKQSINQLKKQVKNLKKTVYIRDSYIELLSDEFSQIFGTILNNDNTDNSIFKSYYQQIVTPQQKDLKSIQMKQAIDAFTKTNSKIFDQMQQLSEIFTAQSTNLTQIEKELNQIKEKYQAQKIKEISETEELSKSYQQLNIIKKQIKNARDKLDEYNLKVKILMDECKKVEMKNYRLKKEGEQMVKKRKMSIERSNGLKLLIDQYYGELENNLKLMGGLDKEEIENVIENQLIEIINYIESLIKNKKRR